MVDSIRPATHVGAVKPLNQPRPVEERKRSRKDSRNARDDEPGAREEDAKSEPCEDSENAAGDGATAALPAEASPNRKPGGRIDVRI